MDNNGRFHGLLPRPEVRRRGQPANSVFLGVSGAESEPRVVNIPDYIVWVPRDPPIPWIWTRQASKGTDTSTPGAVGANAMLTSAFSFAKPHVARYILSLASLFLATPVCFAQGVGEAWKLNLSRHEVPEYFGWSISLDRSVSTAVRRVLIGAPTQDGSGRGGSAHFFRLDGSEWVHEQELRAEVGRVEESFGYDVSLYGNIALVAAPHSWVVHAFRFNGTEWIQDATLGPKEAFDRSLGYWGTTVSIWRDCSLIGARGKAYVFRRTGTEWTEEAELGVGGRGHDHFGMSVSLCERTALIGDHQGYDWYPGKGCAYVFRYDGTQWTNEGVLRAPDGRSGDRFGSSVFMSRDVCIIGASGRSRSEEYGSGGAYVFRQVGKRWTLEQEIRRKLSSPDDDGGGGFAKSTGIDGDKVIVGAPYQGPRRFGSAYIYDRNEESWWQVRQLAATDLALRDHFGWAVSIGRGYVAVGAPNNECNGACYGAVYIRKIPTHD